jgi:hypothetical protein
MMKHIATAALVIGLTNLGGTRVAEATAPQVTVEHFHGLVGEAHFGSFDGQCLLQDVHLVAVQNRTRSTGGPPLASDDVTVEYTVVNFCTLVTLAQGSGSVTGTIGGNLRRLSIRASIPVVDIVLGKTTVEVNVTLTKASPAEREVETTHDSTPTSFMVMHSVSKKVTASAAGTVVLDGTNLIAGLPFDASISDVKSGTLTITRP